MSSDHKVYYSSRGIPLLYNGQSPVIPTITLESYSKWYGVSIIYPNCVVDDIHPDVIDQVAKMHPNALHGDHNYQPAFLHHLADFLQAKVDILALQMAGARWMWEQDGTKFFDHPK